MSDDEWLDVADAHTWLIAQNCYLSAGGMAVEMLTAAIRGGVPVRAIQDGKLLPTKINGAEVRDLDVYCVLAGELRTTDTPYRSAQIERRAFESFVRAEWPDFVPDVHRPGDGAVERAFADSVARHLQAGTHPTRVDHVAELRQELPGMTEDQYNTAKKEAIKAGNCPAEWARAGRRAAGKSR